MDLYNPEYFMKEALKLAYQAYEEGEIPVGAVVVANNKIIGKGYNQTETLNDCTAHAEMIAMTSAFHFLGAKYLMDCDIYVTLEPCPMCAGALNWAKVSNVFYGASDEENGYTKFKSEKGSGMMHGSTSVYKDILGKESKRLIQQFFREIRNK